MIELATGASVGCHSIPGPVQTDRFVSSATMIVNSLYFLSCILFCMIQ